MPDPRKIATVSAGGKLYTSWKSVTVQRDYKNGVSCFQFVASEETSRNRSWGGLFLKPGDPVAISLGGQQVINGYVTKRSVGYDRESHDLIISGKSRTCDVADSSVIIKPGSYAGFNFKQIADGVMQPHGVTTVMKNPPSGWDQPFKFATPLYGETCFAFINRLANLRGLFLCDDKDGNLTAGQADPGAASVADLKEGFNIEWASGTLDDENAWSTTGMIQQFPADDQTWDKARAAAATVTNDTTRSNRVRLVQGDLAANSQELVTRTNFENAITSSTIVEAEIAVAGWFRPDGQLWQPTDNISVLSPMLFPMVDGPVNLSVQSTIFTQNEKGTITTLKIVQPWHLTTMIDPSQPTTGDATNPVANPAPASAQPSGVDSPFAFTG